MWILKEVLLVWLVVVVVLLEVLGWHWWLHPQAWWSFGVQIHDYPCGEHSTVYHLTTSIRLGGVNLSHGNSGGSGVLVNDIHIDDAWVGRIVVLVYWWCVFTGIRGDVGGIMMVILILVVMVVVYTWLWYWLWCWWWVPAVTMEAMEVVVAHLAMFLLDCDLIN